MNRFQKKILTIAAGLANIGLALSAAAVATYAWFAVAKQVQYETTNVTGGLTAFANSSDVSLRYEVLQYDDDLKEGVSYQGDASKFKLRHYDQWIGYNHRYENAILRCEAILTDFDASKEINIDFKCSGNAFDGKANNIAAITSNVIQFKSSVVSYKTAENAEPIKVNSYIEDSTEADAEGKLWVSDAAASYSTATEYFKRQRTSTSFVKAYKETASKYHKTVTEVPYLPIAGNTSIYSIIMYVECSYNERAVENYIRNRASSSTIDLTGDIEQIKFYTSDATPGGYEKLTPNTDEPDQTAAADYVGDYLAINDNSPTTDYANMFDASLETSKISGFANFTQTETLNGGNIIKANSITEKNKFHASQVSGNTYKLETNEGADARTIGKTANSGQTQNHTIAIDSSKTNTFKNNKIYVDDSYQNDNSQTINKSYTFGMNNDQSNARYGYYVNPSSNLYKYSENATPSKLVSIRVVSPKLTYSIGDSFVKPTVYATYQTGGEVAVDIKNACTFEVGGEDASISTSTYGLHKRVKVYYSENGITVSNADNDNYYIDVLSSAYLTMTPEEVTIDIDSSKADHTANLSVELINQVEAPTSITWSSADTTIATVEKTSSENSIPSTATVTAVAIGTTIVTCTVVSNGETYTATCRIVCRDTSGGTAEIEWVKVTEEPEDWSGTYLIVNDGKSKAFDGTATSNFDKALGKTVEISENKISGEQDFYFTIEKNDLIDSVQFYSIKSASNYYIGREATSSGVNYSDSTAYKNTITYSNSSVAITGYYLYSGDYYSSGATLQYNYNGGNDRFQFYTSTQSEIQLYKRTSGTADIVSISYSYDNPDQLTPPKQRVGSNFVPTGMKFYAQFSNGGETEITGAAGLTFTQSATTAGIRDVTATYQGKSIVIANVEWVAKTTFTSLRLEDSLARTNFVAGTEFDPSGLTVIPTYNYGDDNPVTATTWYFSTTGTSGWTTTFPASVNSQTTYYVAASYTDPDLRTTKNTQSAGTSSPTITVYPRYLDSLTKTTAPQLSYANNGKFSVGSAQIDGNYNTSSTYTTLGINFTSNVTTSVSWYWYDGENITTASTITSANHPLADNTTELTYATHNGMHVYAVYQDANAIGTNTRCIDCGPLSITQPSATPITISLDFSADTYGLTETQAACSLTGDGATYGFEFGGGAGAKAYYNNSVLQGAILGKTNAYFRNTSAPSSMYISAIGWSYTGSTSTNVKLRISYGETALSSASSESSDYTAVKNGSVSLTPSDQTKKFFFIRVTNNYNVQLKTFSVTWSPVTNSPSSLFIGDLSNSQRCEINNKLDYELIIQQYFDVALGKVCLNNSKIDKTRIELVNCIERSYAITQNMHNKKACRFILNGLRSN